MTISDKLKKFTILADQSIIAALKKMDEYALRNLIVLSDDYVVGILTDGDIRRAILRNINIGDEVRKAMKTPFIYLLVDDSPQEIVDTFQKEAISIVPIVDEDLKLKNIMTRKMFEELLLSKNQLTTMFDISSFDNIKTEYEVSSRPWGYYKTMVLNEMFQSKVIYILPKQSLSLQSHKRREEHWTIISGIGIVQLEDSIQYVKPGDVIFIPKECKHRIQNESSKEMLIFSEIQLGDYFGEDDIRRYEDMYGRC